MPWPRCRGSPVRRGRATCWRRPPWPRRSSWRPAWVRRAFPWTPPSASSSPACPASRWKTRCRRCGGTSSGRCGCRGCCWPGRPAPRWRCPAPPTRGWSGNPFGDPCRWAGGRGAALGAAAVIASGAPHAWHGFSLLPLAAFAGAITSVVVVYAVARVGDTLPTTTLILAGVAVASFSTAITSYLMLRSTTHTLSVFSVVLGSFNTATWGDFTWTLPYVLPAAAVILLHGRLLNVLSLDEEQAPPPGAGPARPKPAPPSVARLP